MNTDPFETVRPEIVTVLPALIVKTRNWSDEFRRTVKTSRPGPSIVMLELRSGSAADKLIVCDPGAAKTSESNVIVFTSAEAFASRMASRKVHVESQTPSAASPESFTTSDPS